MEKKQKKRDQSKKSAKASDLASDLLNTGMQRFLDQGEAAGPVQKKDKKQPEKRAEAAETQFNLKPLKEQPPPSAADGSSKPAAESGSSGKTRQLFVQLDSFVNDLGSKPPSAPPKKGRDVVAPDGPSERPKREQRSAPKPTTDDDDAVTHQADASDHPEQPESIAQQANIQRLKEQLRALPGWALPTAAAVGLLLLLLILWPSSDAPDLNGANIENPVGKQDQGALIRLQTTGNSKLSALRAILDAAHLKAETSARLLREIQLEATLDQNPDIEQRRLELVHESAQASEGLSTIEVHIISLDELDQIELSIGYFPLDMSAEQLAVAFSAVQRAGSRLDAAAAELDLLSRVYANQESHAGLVTRWQSFGFQWPVDPVEIQSLAEMGSGLPTDVVPLLGLIANSDPSLQASAHVAEGDFAAGIEAWNDGRTALQTLISAAALQYDNEAAQLGSLLERAEMALEKNQLTSPEGDNALEYYRTIQDHDPGNLAAKAGLEKLVEAYHRLVKSALVAGNETLARQHADRARSVLPDSRTVATMQREIASYRQSSRSDQIGVLIQAGLEAEQAGDFERLSEILDEARQVAREPGDIVDLESAFLRLQTKPGRVFSDTLAGDSPVGPEMIVIPVGEYTMGNGSKMLGAVRSERPAHRVLVDQPFAVGRTEVTVGQFAVFVAATGYQTDAESGVMVQVLIGPEPQLANGRSWRNDYLGGEAADSDPVVHVSWQDAQQYVGWLARSANRKYRLLSESEFEYVLRAGSTGRYLWAGNAPPQKTFNINGQLDEPPTAWGGKRARVAVKRYGDSYFGPAPAISFPANAFGIKHMLGNVSEWVEDCYIGDFKNKGTGQRARQLGGCQQRTTRGASWGSAKASLRASWRDQAPADQGSNLIGFRVAVDLGQN